jgi:hypothetical protein
MRKFQLFLVVLMGALIGYKGIVPVAYADDDTFTKIQEMVNDLGGPAKQKANNGKKLACVNGGTKQITIKSSDGGTSYKGVYKNCREYGQTRDGNIEITTGGGRGGEESAKPAKPIDKAFDAMLDDDLAGLTKILKKNKKLVNTAITVPDSEGGETKGWTLLMSAAQKNKIEVVKLLVKFGANMNMVDSEHADALFMAANKGNSEIVSYLISKGAKINNQFIDGTSSLVTAADKGYADVVSMLIKAKADLNLKCNDGLTALISAIGNHYSQIAFMLLDAGANPNITFGKGDTPLALAASRQDAVVVQKLLNVGAKAGYKDALEIAQKLGNQEIIDLLTQYKPKDI